MRSNSTSGRARGIGKGTRMRLKGIISSGLDRAHVFMAQDHYQEQFEQLLGARAWPGTLNVKVAPADLPHWVALREHSGIDTLGLPVEVVAAALAIDVSSIAPFRIRGFLREGRPFGGATAFAATIARIDAPDAQLECAILVPDLTQHVDVIEVISTAKLRDALAVVDGDAVSLIC
jgi:CTP-dependent riboflavin kinase